MDSIPLMLTNLNSWFRLRIISQSIFLLKVLRSHTLNVSELEWKRKLRCVRLTRNRIYQRWIRFHVIHISARNMHGNLWKVFVVSVVAKVRTWLQRIGLLMIYFVSGCQIHFNYAMLFHCFEIYWVFQKEFRRLLGCGIKVRDR